MTLLPGGTTSSSALFVSDTSVPGSPFAWKHGPNSDVSPLSTSVAVAVKRIPGDATGKPSGSGKRALPFASAVTSTEPMKNSPSQWEEGCGVEVE